MAACKEACSKFACCNLPENLESSCLQGNHISCLEVHKECSILNTGTAHVDVTAFALPPAPKNLFEICSVNSLATGRGLRRCRTVCSAATCCFSNDLSDGELSCRDVEQCRGYASCLNLEAGKAINQKIQDEVAAKCTTDQVETVGGAAICRSVCQQHTCCWRGTLRAGSLLCFLPIVILSFLLILVMPL